VQPPEPGCSAALAAVQRLSRRASTKGTAVTTKLFGEPVRRREDARPIVGKGRYLDDIGHTALAAAFVRSPRAHARILDIDVEGALDVEGLVAIYTYEDSRVAGAG
jgi:CO/xanthine dehydrogenase Mo-binding subunit